MAKESSYPPKNGDSNGDALPDSRKDEVKNKQDEVAYWNNEISAARKREEKWQKDAKRATALYEGDKSKDYQYNILYANTETMSPALYNEVPRPIVARRYKDDDPIGKKASEVCQRTLEFLSDSSLDEYSTYDDVMKFAVLSALVPGRGVVRLKYDSQIIRDGDSEKVKNEYVCPEEVPWDRFNHGFATVWRKVPWVSFDHFMTRDELKDNFGDDLTDEQIGHIPLNFTPAQVESNLPQKEKSEQHDDAGRPMLSRVVEIWDKAKREVLFIIEGFGEKVVRRVKDPLGLTGFFPMPKPLVFFAKLKTLTPTTLYKQYEEQARELNHLTLRINKLIAAMRVRGVYDPRFTEITRMMEEDDGEENVLWPATDNNVSLGNDFSGFDKAIWLMPIDKQINVLSGLYQQREQIKVVIYEIMGIADILRGSSKASETLGAQNLKAQWGSLRLKRMQKAVMQFCRDLFRIMGEIAMTKFSTETIAKMTGIPLPTNEQKAMAQKIVAQHAQLSEQAEPPPIPGAPPMPPAPPVPPPPPEVIEATESPTWEEVMTVLKDDLTRAYRIDVETNSTIDPEATEDQKNITELMTAISQFTNGMGPLVAEGIMPFEIVKSMLLFVTRRFRMGNDVEDFIKGMEAPPPKQDASAQPDPAKMAQVEIDKEAAIHKGKMEEQTFQHQTQSEQQRMAFEQKKHEDQMALEKYKADRNFELEQYKLGVDSALERDKLRLQLDADVSKTRVVEGSKREMEKLKLAANQQSDSANREAATARDLLKALTNIVAKGEGKDGKGGQTASAQSIIADLRQLLGAAQTGTPA